MGKFVVGNGQYVVYAKDGQEARQIISRELQRVDKIKEKIANLLSPDGIAMQNFMENTSEENLNIEFNDESSLIFDNPENVTTKGRVVQRSLQNGKFTYNLAYLYPEIQGHNADFRLAHEMGHLVLNPSNEKRQDKRADDLVKLLAVSMRNDFEKEINFEQLAEQKIDSFIENSDGTKEPANTFFYGI